MTDVGKGSVFEGITKASAQPGCGTRRYRLGFIAGCGAVLFALAAVGMMANLPKTTGYPLADMAVGVFVGELIIAAMALLTTALVSTK